MASNDSVGKTFGVALSLCLVCSFLVSLAAVGLKERQEENKLLDKKKIVLRTAGLISGNVSKEEILQKFEMFEVKLVDLETGEYVDGMDPATFDQREASKKVDLSIAVAGSDDIAGLKRRSKYAKVFIYKESDAIKLILLPVRGTGLWSMMYGYLALESDFNTVKGLAFYEQGETAGLGGEVDNPKWKALWSGKKVFSESGDVALKVIKGVADRSSEHEIDGLSGATITSNGVTYMIQYWLGESGFGNYLQKLKSL